MGIHNDDPRAHLRQVFNRAMREQGYSQTFVNALIYVMGDRLLDAVIAVNDYLPMKNQQAQMAQASNDSAAPEQRV